MLTSSVAASPDRAAAALISLRSEKDFRRVRAHGKVVRHALFTLRVTDYRPRYGETWRPRAMIGIVVSKKTLKHAVKRNRVRRRVREALRTLPGLPPCRATIHPTPLVLNAPFNELQAALAKALAGDFKKKTKPDAPRPSKPRSGNAKPQSKNAGQP